MPHTVTIDDTGERYACDQEESLLTAMVLVLLGRLLTVYPLCLAFARSRWAIPLNQGNLELPKPIRIFPLFLMTLCHL